MDLQTKIEIEALVATLDLKNLFQNNSKLTTGLVKESKKFTDKLATMVADVVNGKEIKTQSTISLKQSEEIQNLLINTTTPELLEKLLPQLRAKSIDPQLMIAQLQNIFDYLIAQLPADLQVEDSFMMSTPIKSSRTLLTHFTWAVRIADNPLQILHLMSAQMLSKMDVEAIQNMYPDIFQAMIGTFVEKIIEGTYTHLSRRLKQQLGVLLEIPVLNIQTIEAYKKNNETQQADKEKADIQIKTEAPQGGRRLGDL